jgi:hypothetical protein
VVQGSQGLDLGAYWQQGEDRRVGTVDAGGGSRWRLCSGEPAVRLGQRVRGGAPVGPRKAGQRFGRLGNRVGTEVHRAAPMVNRGGSGRRRLARAAGEVLCFL